MAAVTKTEWANSRYNFAVPVKSALLLYNAGTGAVLMLSGRDAERLACELTSKPHVFCNDSIDGGLCEQLLSGGFLVDAGTDEVSIIRKRFLEARRQTPIVL